jgi:hypothetical protein
LPVSLGGFPEIERISHNRGRAVAPAAKVSLCVSEAADNAQQWRAGIFVAQSDSSIPLRSVNVKNFLLLPLLTSLCLVACSGKDDAAAPAAAPSEAVAAAPNTGKILQLSHAAGYTYAEVQAAGDQKVWMAGAPLQLKLGDRVQWGDYAVMQNFTSKALGRTFDQILFVNAWGPVGGLVAQVAPHGAPPSQAGHQATPPQVSSTDANQGKVKSVSASGGYTYLEIDQNGVIVWVAVPGTVVKVGETVAWDGGAVMQNFTAKSLSRTFDRIIFAGKVTVVS